MVCNSALNSQPPQRKNSNNMESLTLQVDGPITVRAYNRNISLFASWWAYNREGL